MLKIFLADYFVIYFPIVDKFLTFLEWVSNMKKNISSNKNNYANVSFYPDLIADDSFIEGSNDTDVLLDVACKNADDTYGYHIVFDDLSEAIIGEIN